LSFVQNGYYSVFYIKNLKVILQRHQYKLSPITFSFEYEMYR